jgi:hypothetical protein
MDSSLLWSFAESIGRLYMMVKVWVCCDLFMAMSINVLSVSCSWIVVPHSLGHQQLHMLRYFLSWVQSAVSGDCFSKKNSKVNIVPNIIIIQRTNTKIECMATGTPEKCKGNIRCCRGVTPAVCLQRFIYNLKKSLYFNFLWGIVVCKTNSKTNMIPIFMHQMCISTN